MKRIESKANDVLEDEDIKELELIAEQFFEPSAHKIDEIDNEFEDLFDELNQAIQKPKPKFSKTKTKEAPIKRASSWPKQKLEKQTFKRPRASKQILRLRTTRKLPESDFDQTDVSTIDLSRERREGEEKNYDGGSAYIMATALTAAALSSYFVVKSFKAIFL